MKHSDPGIGGGVRSRLSPLARPFTFGSSSSSIQPRSSSLFSLAASESEPEDSIWGDYAFDLSFLTSDDQRSGGLDDDSLSNLSRDTEATTLLKEGSELFRQTAYTSETKTNFGFPIKDRITLASTRHDNVESFLGLSNFLESDLRSADSQPQVSPSIPVISTNQLKADATLEEGCSAHFSSASIPGDTSAARAANGVLVDNVISGGGGTAAAAERQQSYAKEKAACFGEGLVDQRIDENDPCSFFSKMSELHIRCSSSADNDMLDLLGAKATGMSEKSCIPSEDDSEVDSPCWRGIHSYNTLASGSRALCSRRSSDDLNRLYRLNPLAPHFIPANAKKSLDKHAKECNESSSSSLKKSLSSTFPLSSGDYGLTDPHKAVIQQTCDRTNGATGASFLTHKADQSFGFASQDSVSNAASILDPSNEFQTSKKLDPSAPLFVPASAKLSAAIHEKQRGVDRMVAFETNAHSTAALSSLGNRVLNNVKAERCTAEVGSFGNQYYNGVHEPGTSDSFNAWLGSEVGISENASPDSSEKLHGRPRLNPPAHQFALADTRRNVDGFEKKHGTDDSLPVMNRAISSAFSVYRDHNVIDTGLVRSKSSVHIEPYSSRNGMIQMECVHPSNLPGSSSLISSVAAQSAKVEDKFASAKQFLVEPKALSMKGNKDVEHQLCFHISEDPAFSSSKHVKALSDFSQRHGCASSSPSPEMDVKKLLTTMNGLSELLTLVQGHSYGSDSPDEKELALINSIVHNLNLYIRNGVEEHAGNSSSDRRGSFEPKQLANMHELSIKELQPPRAKDMTVKLDLKRKEKYTAVSGEMVPDTQLRESGVSKGNGFSQVTANSGLQQNHPTEEQINPQVLFYRSLWLKAEAERCLIEYEASLSGMKR